jgi:flagellar assembly factor FliW
MKVHDAIEAEQTDPQHIQIPAGLLGLEQIKEYELIAVPAEEPFMWLQSVGTPDVAFLLVSPFLVLGNYRPDISDHDLEALGLSDCDGALLYNIVTLRGNAPATVNLKGPIAINRLTKIAKQVVLNNAADYCVRHPIITS